MADSRNPEVVQAVAPADALVIFGPNSFNIMIILGFDRTLGQEKKDLLHENSLSKSSYFR